MIIDGKKRKIELYHEWVKEEHLCACGCGERLEVSYQVFLNCLNEGKLPQYKQFHHKNTKKRKNINNDKKEKKNVSFNGCSIHLFYTNEIRCDDFDSCKDYLDCLEFVVVENKALGWKKI